MIFVPRKALLVKEKEDDKSPPAQPAPIENFRTKPVWILLGEPGAGKSRTLRTEADSTGGIYVTTAELISTNPPLDEWRNQTLYIDALDESRAAGTESPLLKVRNQLRQLKTPSFRLACRAADWHGESDLTILRGLVPSNEMVVLQLSPLSRDDIEQLLKNNHEVNDPSAFIEHAERNQIAPLLENPQALELLANAIRGSEWPNSRAEVYELACKTLLVKEHNANTRRLTRQHAQTPEQNLKMAGHLCAVLLLAGKQGLATDPDSANQNFPSLDDFASIDRAKAESALGTKLFIPEPGHEERLIPIHRTVAEYLAARWLAGELDSKRLPLQRALSLLQGIDGGVVADLRGLYAWLALCSSRARRRLIEADPVSVILYGDTYPMSVGDKRSLFYALKTKAIRDLHFRGHMDEDQRAFGGLADPALTEDFRAALTNHNREASDQAFVSCVLDILQYGAIPSELTNIFRDIVVDATRWPGIRSQALHLYLRRCKQADALDLLRQVTSGNVGDDDDQLLGELLKHLYPEHLDVGELLQNIHPPKKPNYFGSYLLFWSYFLPKKAHESQLPELLDELCLKTKFFSDIKTFSTFQKMAADLLVRALQTHGHSVNDKRLFAWLAVGADEHGHFQRDKESHQKIGFWLGKHPARYKAILALCIEHSRHYHHARLHDATVPEDIGLWHLQQAEKSKDDIAAMHLDYAVHALENQKGSPGLSLEIIEQWSAQNPELSKTLNTLLYCPLNHWQHDRAKDLIEHKVEKIAELDRRTNNISPHINAIRNGTAQPGLLNQLAGVWLKQFWDIEGETVEARFDAYSKFGQDLMISAAAGFKTCPLREDIPTVDEIIALNLKKQRHFIGQPCLLGMKLRWEDNSHNVLSLSTEALRRMLAFFFTYSNEEIPEWFRAIAAQSPELVTEIAEDVASAELKAGYTYVFAIETIAHDPQLGDIANRATPKLLKAFPLRAKKDQLSILGSLLRIAMHSSSENLRGVIEEKLSLKSIDAAQRVHWLAAQTILDPKNHETTLWQYIGKSEIRANIVSDFFRKLRTGNTSEYTLQSRTLGKIIEIVAPHAEMTRRNGVITDAMERGDQIRGMITELSMQSTLDAAQELGRLRLLPALKKLQFALDYAIHAQQIAMREENFQFLDAPEVARILEGAAPANTADMTALTLDLLDDIAEEIRGANDDGYKAFWNIKSGKPDTQRDENTCRDTLLARLRPKVEALGINIDPEADRSGDKRADLCLTYRNQFVLPIEIKRDSNIQLWTAIKTQLIDQYTREPKSDGFGIYFVLWFGNPSKIAKTIDGGRKPQSPQELRTRLEAQLTPEQLSRIFIRVLDVSWPD